MGNDETAVGKPINLSLDGLKDASIKLGEIATPIIDIAKAGRDL